MTNSMNAMLEMPFNACQDWKLCGSMLLFCMHTCKLSIQDGTFSVGLRQCFNPGNGPAPYYL